MEEMFEYDAVFGPGPFMDLGDPLLDSVFDASAFGRLGRSLLLFAERL